MTPPQPQDQPTHISPEAREAADTALKMCGLSSLTKYKRQFEVLIQSALDKQKAEHEKEIADLKETRAILQSQVDNADTNLEQQRISLSNAFAKEIEKYQEVVQAAKALAPVSTEHCQCSYCNLSKALSNLKTP